MSHAERQHQSDRAMVWALAGACGGCLLLWLAALTGAWLRHSSAPSLSALRVAQLLLHPSDPAAAWGVDVGSASTYWGLLLLLILAIAAPAELARRHRIDSSCDNGWVTRVGIAARSEVRAAAGAAHVRNRVGDLRPSCPGGSVESV